MSWLRLEEKVAVVTGAGRGIGAEIASELCRNGARVAVIDLDAQVADDVAAELRASGADTISLQADTTDDEAIVRAHGQIIEKWGRVDVLVNNAGTGGTLPLKDVSLKEWRRVLDINLTGYLICSQVFGSTMREQGSGSIVHVASICGHEPLAGSGSYSASKAGVLMLSRSLALEWGPDGIRSNSLSPGMTRTPLTERAYQTDGVLEHRSQIAPLRRIATTQDMADACVWLASERSAYVTGQDICVDGGLSQTVMLQTAVPPS